MPLHAVVNLETGMQHRYAWRSMRSSSLAVMTSVLPETLEIPSKNDGDWVEEVCSVAGGLPFRRATRTARSGQKRCEYFTYTVRPISNPP